MSVPLRRRAARLAALVLSAGLLGGCGESADTGPSEASIKGNEASRAAWEQAKKEQGKKAGIATNVKRAPTGSMADKYKGVH